MNKVSIQRRAINPSDLAFLRELYASTRADELAAVPWDQEQKSEFLSMQFEAQHKFYTQTFAQATYDIVELDDKPGGRLYVDQREDEIRILDISLMPQYRGKGIGQMLMQEMLDEGKAKGQPVRIHVESNNPARRLYDRMGFRHIEDQGIYQFLEWSPPTQ